MPSIRYVNQTAPFWDFVASLENQGPSNNNPFTGPSAENRENRENSDEEGSRGPWGRGPWMGGPGGPRGWHRGPPPPWGGRHGGPHPPPPHPEGHPHPHHGGPPPPPPPPGHEGYPPPPPPPGSNPEDPASPQEGEGEHHRDGSPHHSHHRRGHCGRRGGGRPGSWGRGGPFFNTGPFPFGGASGFADIAEVFQKQLFGGITNNDDNEKDNGQRDFQPEADVFDTENAYVIHVSLPGAKKEDIGVSWDAEKSEISISGVIHRPGDEEFIKTLAMDERKVGPFERKIRLGSRANPAQVDDDAISAKLEDGILRVEVPKLDRDYVEIKKVDIL